MKQAYKREKMSTLLLTTCPVVFLQGRLDDVVGTLQEMRDMPEGKGPNLVNYNIAIGSCARARCVLFALQVAHLTLQCHLANAFFLHSNFPPCVTGRLS